MVREGVGRLLVAYLIVVSTAANFALHGFLTKVMNFIIVAVRARFVRQTDPLLGSERDV